MQVTAHGPHGQEAAFQSFLRDMQSMTEHLVLTAMNPRAPVPIYWRDGVPKEIIQALSPILQEFSYVWPSWVEEVGILYEGDNTDDLLNINISYRYRYARLTICGTWLTLPDAERTVSIVHEIAHALINPLFTETCTALEHLLKPKNPNDTAAAMTYDYTMHVLNSAREACVEDIARVLVRGHYFAENRENERRRAELTQREQKS